MQDFTLDNLGSNMITSQRLVREKYHIQVYDQYKDETSIHNNKDVNFLPDKDQIILKDIFSQHLNHNKYFDEECLISYFDTNLKLFVYCGTLKECQNIP